MTIVSLLTSAILRGRRFILTAGLVAALAASHAGVVSRAAPQTSADLVSPVLAQTMARDGEASYLVFMRDTANLAVASTMADRESRGWFVYRTLTDTASRSQGALLAHLDAERRAGRARFVKSFFSANAIGVTSRPETLQSLAQFPGIDRIIPAPVASIPQPTLGTDIPSVNAIEWNINKVRAPEVWAAGVRGDGIVVANIDSGVQFTHPALVGHYRGNLGGGSFNHNYNWWDPSRICGSPSTAPCDNAGHGSHTMGTMVGDDGGTNQIGVAPHAQWMACKGCETNNCSAFALLECADFVLAPWDLNHTNPDPSRRPHVVNNSWGGGGGDSWYRSSVNAWRAAGIFPAFSAGNSGPFCTSAGSPGDYPESFASGATDINDVIASFSSRGPSLFGMIKKPDVSAPGVNVRSSVPTNTYQSFNGTSMASPHTAGIVALLWSAFPGLNRDVPNTELKLRPSTIILNSGQACGGDTARNVPNNTYGSGRMDAVRVMAPFNIYTNQGKYAAGDTLTIRVNLVNPNNAMWNVDGYVVFITPSGPTAFPLGPISLPPLYEQFGTPLVNVPVTGIPLGQYYVVALFTVPGSDPSIPANQLSLDFAGFVIQ